MANVPATRFDLAANAGGRNVANFPAEDELTTSQLVEQLASMRSDAQVDLPVSAFFVANGLHECRQAASRASRPRTLVVDQPQENYSGSQIRQRATPRMTALCKKDPRMLNDVVAKRQQRPRY